MADIASSRSTTESKTPPDPTDSSAQPEKPANSFKKTIMWERRAGMFGRNPVAPDRTS